MKPQKTPSGAENPLPIKPTEAQRRAWNELWRRLITGIRTKEQRRAKDDERETERAQNEWEEN